MDFSNGTSSLNSSSTRSSSATASMMHMHANVRVKPTIKCTEN